MLLVCKSVVSLLALLVAFLAGAKHLRRYVFSKTLRKTIPRSEFDIRNFVRQEFFVTAELISTINK